MREKSEKFTDTYANIESNFNRILNKIIMVFMKQTSQSSLPLREYLFHILRSELMKCYNLTDLLICYVKGYKKFLQAMADLLQNSSKLRLEDYFNLHPKGIRQVTLEEFSAIRTVL